MGVSFQSRGDHFVYHLLAFAALALLALCGAF
jgi:hypothetical protein